MRARTVFEGTFLKALAKREFCILLVACGKPSATWMLLPRSMPAPLQDWSSLYVLSTAAHTPSPSTPRLISTVNPSHSSFLWLTAIPPYLWHLWSGCGLDPVPQGSRMVSLTASDSAYSLIVHQGAIRLCSAILDCSCWPLDTLEDPKSPGYTWLGMANPPRGRCWVYH